MDALVRLKNFIEDSKPWVGVGILLIVHTLLHVKYLNLPPVGFHQWRQTQTLSVARNFYEEGMNIFLPRVDNRGSHSGITGMEFPLVNFLIAIGYKVFGVHHFVERVVLLLFSYLAIALGFLFFKELFRETWLGLAGAFFLAFSPLFSYYSIVVLPDVPSLALMLAALYFLQRDITSQISEPSTGFLISLTVAALVKVYAVILLLPAGYYYLFKTRSRFAEYKGAIMMAASLLVVTIWYLYARFLSEAHHNFDFRLESNFPYSISLVPHVLWKVFVQWLPEMYINYPAFAFFLVGCYSITRRENKPLGILVSLYLIPTLGYFILFLPMFDMHDYYAMPVLPVLVIVTVLGLKTVVQFSGSKRWVHTAAVATLAVVPIVGSIRALSRFEGASIDPALIGSEQCLDKVIHNRKALIIAASDDSPSIYLYFMHRKGWHAAESVPTSDFEEMIREGAAYLVSDSRSLEERVSIRSHLARVSSCGRFNIFTLHE